MSGDGESDAAAPPHEVVDRREEWDGVVPVPNGGTAPFWAATVEGRLLVQHCDACDTHQFYPRVVCTTCGALEPEYVESAGTGTVHSYTVCHIPGAAGFDDLTPYAVAIVELAEGPRMTAFVEGDPGDVSMGTDLEVAFWRVSDDAAIPVFRPRS